MPFQFRYATVQKIRKSARDEKRAALGEALAAEQEILDRLEALRRRLEDLRVERTKGLRGGTLQIPLLRQYNQCERQILDSIAEENAHLVSAQCRTEMRRAALVEVDKEVKQFDKLEEKQREQFEIDERRKAA